MQIVDDLIRCALRRAAERCGSILALSKLLEVSHSTVLFWLNGRIRNISTDIWFQKVFPVLEEDLCFLSGSENPGELRSCYLQSFRTSGSRSMHVPLLEEGELLLYRTPLENIASFFHRNAKYSFFPGKESFFPGKEYFVVQLHHLMERYMLPWETFVFITENIRLADRELVLLRIRSEDFLRICRFRSAGNENADPVFEDFINGRIIAGGGERACRSLSSLEWVFPAVEIRFCCRRGQREQYAGDQ